MGWSGQGGSVLIRRGGDSSFVATPLGDPTGGSKALELLTDWSMASVHREKKRSLS